MKKIIGQIDLSRTKRCRINASVEIKCPSCGNKIKCDFYENYLMEPEVGGKDTIYFYCESCDLKNNPCGFKIPIIVKSADMVIEYDENKITED